MIWYLALIIATIFSFRELFKTYMWLEKWKYIYWCEAHSKDHFNYLFAYCFSLIVTWIYVLWFILFEYVIFFWGISSIILLYHIRSERKEHLHTNKY
jgi:hypothetical protein